jgi:CARDB protein
MKSRARHGRVAVAVVVGLVAGLFALATGAEAGQPGAAPTAGDRTAGARLPLPYGARLMSCRRSPRIAARIATVGATMRPIPGGAHLALRISLFQRALGATGRWTLRSDVPGLGSWTAPSDPTIGSRAADVFKYRQAVGRLVVPFSYKFRVEFRWTGDAGEVVRRARATTGTCREPDVRPDLLLERVAVVSAVRPDRARYEVTVRNDGRSTARGVLVSSSFPSEPAASDTRTVGRLRPGDTAVVAFLGPLCSAVPAPPSFTADPANAIEESRETNNSLAADCAPVATLSRR